MAPTLKIAVLAVVCCVVLVLGAGRPASAGSCIDCYHGCRNTCDAKAEADCGSGLQLGSRSEAECVGCKLRSYHSCKEPCDKGCSTTCDKVLLGSL